MRFSSVMNASTYIHKCIDRYGLVSLYKCLPNF